MAKGKDVGGNNYTPIKNPELLQGQPDKLTVEQRVAVGKNENMKKDGESFADSIRRRVKDELDKQKDNIKEVVSPYKGNDKTKEPEKDK